MAQRTSTRGSLKISLFTVRTAAYRSQASNNTGCWKEETKDDCEDDI
jgi:1,2-phenylacetyl-CoA epoxidase PaaB subunit